MKLFTKFKIICNLDMKYNNTKNFLFSKLNKNIIIII